MFKSSKGRDGELAQNRKKVKEREKRAIFNNIKKIKGEINLNEQNKH